MTDEEYFSGLFTLNHGPNCGWHCDQYWWECDCGAITPELRAEYVRRTAPGHTDLMVAPETLDEWLEKNPPPEGK